MDIEVEELITGHKYTVVSDLIQRVTDLQAYNFVKIGQTSNYVRRMKKHALSKKHAWKKMIVLYSSTSHSSISYIEKVLINHLKNKHPRSVVNIAPGGEGVNNPASHKRFYIYLLLKSKRSNTIA